MKHVLCYVLSILAGALLCVWASADDAPVDAYVRWVRVDNARQHKGTSVILNKISTSSVIHVPPLVGNMVLVDATKYVRTKGDFADPDDLARFLKAWEELRFDPAFNVLAIRNGKVVRTTLHDPELIARHQTQAPVVEFRYLLTRSLTTVKDQFGDATIFGGSYYDLAGYPKTEGELLKQLGIDPGDDLLAYFDKLPSQLRVAMEKSAVTGKTRRIDFLPTAARATGAWLSATRDVEDGEQAGKNDPLESLARMIVKAVEILHARANGMEGFFLSDGRGDRQDVAPHQVVAADMVLDRQGRRNPHSTRLQGPIDCIVCHMAASDGARGLLAVRNDVLLQRRAGIEINSEQLKRLYNGDPDTLGEDLQLFIERARDDQVLAFIRATGGWPGLDLTKKEDTTKIVRQVAEFLVSEFREYNYEPVDARQALREIGVAEKIPDAVGDAAALFNKMVPVSRGEDINLARLRKGFEISRFRWSLIRAEVFLRRVR